MTPYTLGVAQGLTKQSGVLSSILLSPWPTVNWIVFKAGQRPIGQRVGARFIGTGLRHGLEGKSIPAAAVELSSAGMPAAATSYAMAQGLGKFIREAVGHPVDITTITAAERALGRSLKDIAAEGSRLVGKRGVGEAIESAAKEVGEAFIPTGMEGAPKDVIRRQLSRAMDLMTRVEKAAPAAVAKEPVKVLTHAERAESLGRVGEHLKDLGEHLKAIRVEERLDPKLLSMASKATWATRKGVGVAKQIAEIQTAPMAKAREYARATVPVMAAPASAYMAYKAHGIMAQEKPLPAARKALDVISRKLRE